MNASAQSVRRLRSLRRRASHARVEPSRLHPRDMLAIGTAGLRTRRLRTALTAAGIAIGIAAMVAVLGISESSRAELLSALDRLGTNLLTVSPGQTLGGEDASLSEDAGATVRRIGGVEAASATGAVEATVRRTDRIPAAETGGISVLAAETTLLETLRAQLRDGVFLNAATEQYPAVVLGSTAARRLGIEGVDGRTQVWLGDSWFTVVGILRPVELAPGLDSAALVGFPAAASLGDEDVAPSTVYVRTDPVLVDDVRSVLAATVRPSNPEEVQVSRPSDAIEARAAAATAFTALFLGLGAVALAVGGVGVANVMLMAVLERRSEIGLRRALGATRRHIALQFVAEALVVAAIGGVLGSLLGVGIAAAYAGFRDWAVVVPPVAIVGGVLASLAIGAVAGLYPALRAARVSPTEALRGG